MIDAIIEHIQSKGFDTRTNFGIDSNYPDTVSISITKAGYERVCAVLLNIDTRDFSEHSDLDHWLELANTHMTRIDNTIQSYIQSYRAGRPFLFPLNTAKIATAEYRKTSRDTQFLGFAGKVAEEIMADDDLFSFFFDWGLEEQSKLATIIARRGHDLVWHACKDICNSFFSEDFKPDDFLASVSDLAELPKEKE